VPLVYTINELTKLLSTLGAEMLAADSYTLSLLKS